MAKSKFEKSRTLTEKIAITGTLSEDAKTIEYVGKNDEQCEVSIADCLMRFAGDEISFTITSTSKTDLD